MRACLTGRPTLRVPAIALSACLALSQLPGHLHVCMPGITLPACLFLPSFDSLLGLALLRLPSLDSPRSTSCRFPACPRLPAPACQALSSLADPPYLASSHPFVPAFLPASFRLLSPRYSASRRLSCMPGVTLPAWCPLELACLQDHASLSCLTPFLPAWSCHACLLSDRSASPVWLYFPANLSECLPLIRLRPCLSLFSLFCLACPSPCLPN
jgi:hypothetical protein